MNNKPLVSIIIPTKNSAEFLENCLKSIKEQSYKNIEIIVVDNNSTDDTKKIARRYTDKVYNKGPERSAQRNFGATKAVGDYLYFVDADFDLEKKVVEQASKEIQKGLDAVVVHNSPDTSVSWIAKVRKFETDMYKYNLDHSAARFFKKDIFKKICGYAESITAGEDYDIQNKLNKAGYKTGFIDAEALHLGEPTSIIRHMKKYYDYGKDFKNYKKTNETESSKQLGFIRPVYATNWRKFLEQPVLGVIFIIYHTFKFIFGSIGYLVGNFFK